MGPADAASMLKNVDGSEITGTLADQFQQALTNAMSEAIDDQTSATARTHRPWSPSPGTASSRSST